MQTRVDIKDFVNKIEHSFPTHEWKINNIHVWPILRLRLHFYLINFLENKPQKKANRRKRRSFKSFLKEIYFSIVYLLFLISLKTVNKLFVGSDEHRIDYKKTRFNRFFDVFIEKNKLTSYGYLEYGFTSYKNQKNKQNIFFTRKSLKGFKFLHSFKKQKSKIELDKFDEFESFLVKKGFSSFLEINNKHQFIDWFNKDFYNTYLFYKQVLLKINPSEIYILCYYGEEIMALTAAANKLNISTIEYQHGPQVDVHLAYGSWTNLPIEGFDVLPRIFWVWDSFSENVLQKWIRNNKNYSTRVVGNFWIDYFKEQQTVYPFKDFILYCVQPHPFTLEQLFTPNLLSCIKNSQFIWFIRLHPRQLNDKDLIVNFLKQHNVLEKVNIENATNDFLPELMANAKIHLTHYSGTTLEARDFGKKTVLLNKIGENCFADLIKERSAFFIDPNNSEFCYSLNKFIQDVDK